MPYAGLDLGPVPPTLAVPGVSQVTCPDYILMQNYDISVENPYPEFGLFIAPRRGIGCLRLPVPRYTLNQSYWWLHSDQADAACGVTPGIDGGTGGPVFPIFLDTELNGAYFLDGGSLGPDLPGTDN